MRSIQSRTPNYRVITSSRIEGVEKRLGWAVWKSAGPSPRSAREQSSRLLSVLSAKYHVPRRYASLRTHLRWLLSALEPSLIKLRATQNTSPGTKLKQISVAKTQLSSLDSFALRRSQPASRHSAHMACDCGGASASNGSSRLVLTNWLHHCDLVAGGITRAGDEALRSVLVVGSTSVLHQSDSEEGLAHPGSWSC
jgi:hypothetical protein